MTVMSQSVDIQHKDRYSPGTIYEQDTPDNTSLYQIMPQDRVTYWERIFSQQLTRLQYPYTRIQKPDRRCLIQMYNMAYFTDVPANVCILVHTPEGEYIQTI